MKMEIGSLIESLLYENDNLVVPGLGVFTSKPTAAAIDYLGEVIAPPTKIIAFDENLQSNDGLLVQKVIDTQQVDLTEAERIVSSYVAKLKESLENREIVTIPGVGRLYKNYAKKIQFLPETTNFRADSFGLPHLQAAAHRANTVSGQDAVAVGSPNTSVQAEAKAPQPTATPGYQKRISANTWLILGGLLLAIAVALGYYLATKNSTSVANGNLTKPTPASPVIAPIETAKAAVEQVNAEANREVAPSTSPKDDIADEVAEATAKQKEALKLRAKTKPVSKNEAAKSSNGSTGKRRCVLVIGTFQDKDNVAKLKSKLESNGYNSYHRLVDGQHQVGVEFMYNTLHDIQKVMESVQKLTGQDNIWIKRR